MLSILSSTYFGPVQWYQKLQRSEACLIEQHENFVKQTYRNRMIIATANGPQALTIPTTHGESPFFPYYQDDLRPFFEKKYEFLFDFNMEITHKMIELLDIRPHLSLTDHYLQGDELKDFCDYRESIRPKHPLPDADFVPHRYYQVYEHKLGFLPNMSILDLLFNEGNESILHLI